jgi:hypothetical protein
MKRDRRGCASLFPMPARLRSGEICPGDFFLAAARFRVSQGCGKFDHGSGVSALPGIAAEDGAY